MDKLKNKTINQLAATKRGRALMTVDHYLNGNRGFKNYDDPNLTIDSLKRTPNDKKTRFPLK